MTSSAIETPVFQPGTPGPSVARLHELPGINLMPPEIAERAELQRLKALCAAAVAVSLVVVGGLYYQAHNGVTSAKKGLTSAQSEQTKVQGQVNSLAWVAQTYAQVEAAKQQVAEALGGEVQWSTYLNDLTLSIPDGVWLTSMTVAAATPATTPAAGAAASPTAAGTTAATPNIATISFSGTARNRDAVAKWLESLVNEKGYTNPYVTTTSETKIDSTTVVNFASTVNVTSAALSGRYTTTSGS